MVKVPPWQRAPARVVPHLRARLAVQASSALRGRVQATGCTIASGVRAILAAPKAANSASFDHAGWEHVYFDQPYNRPADFEADGGASKSAGVGPARRRLLAWKDWRSLTPLVTRECV